MPSNYKEEPLFPVLDKYVLKAEKGPNSPDELMKRKEGISESIEEVYSSLSNPGLGRAHTMAFNRYYKIFPDDELGNIFSYVFMVKPDLNMDYAINADPYFGGLVNTHVNVVLNLTHPSEATYLAQEAGKCGGVPDHHFVPFLTNRVESYNVPDVNLKTFDMEQPFTNFPTVYGANSNESRTGSQFDITFKENKQLDITRFFDAWIRYIDAINLGNLHPKSKYLNAKVSMGSSIIDYGTSIYLIDTLADGGEIVYFHKTTGAFPTSAPHSTWSFTSGGKVDSSITVQFSGGLPEPLNPMVLADFNYNAGCFNGTGNIIRTLDYNNPIVGAPFITFNPTKNKYYLRWRALN